MTASLGASGAEPAARLQPASDPDAALIRGMAAGKTEAMDALYQRHGSGILSYLIGQLRDRQTAEEVLQDVMLAAWKAAGGFRGDCKVRTWLLVIAHRRALNARRKRRPDTISISDDNSHLYGRSPAADQALEGKLDLRKAIEGLPEAHRSALELVFFHELSIEDAAGVLDVAPGTVKSRVFRAKRMLRERMAEPGGADHHV